MMLDKKQIQVIFFSFFLFFSSTTLLLPTPLPPPLCTHAQSCNPMDCSPPGSSVHGLFQARILEWVAISFSMIFLFEFKMGCKAAETTCSISTFGPGTANKHRVQWWFKKFCKGDESL